MDVVIDGYGPSYSEKRLLVERAPSRTRSPWKPKASEAPAAVDISKPAIVYGAPKEPGVLRKERPAPKAVTSEVNATSSRRRKMPKRRIVDLATGDAAAASAAVGLKNDAPSTTSEPQVAALSPPGNYHISRPSESTLLPPVILSDSRQGTPSADAALLLDAAAEAYGMSGAQSDGMESQGWDVGGEIYRRKIEALRNRVGNGYISVLSEESWDSNGSYSPAGVSRPNPPRRPCVAPRTTGSGGSQRPYAGLSVYIASRWLHGFGSTMIPRMITYLSFHFAVLCFSGRHTEVPARGERVLL